MSDVAVLTDSCASIPENILKDLHIHTVAYYLHRGQEVLRDLITIQREDFLRWLTTARSLPTTASPGPGDYFEAYKQLAIQGIREIISIQMSSKISGGFQAASVAQTMLREEFPEVRIEVLDTHCRSAARGALPGMDGHRSRARCSARSFPGSFGLHR